MLYGQELSFGAADLTRLAQATILGVQPNLLPPSSPGPAFDDLPAYLQTRIAAAARVRRQFWRLDDSPRQDNALRHGLERLMGIPPTPAGKAAPTLKPIGLTPHFKAWEVRLPVTGGMEAVGHLRIPRHDRLLPAVVSQHGLDGQPKDISGVGEAPNAVYHHFGGKLAERGYVVCAPYLTVRKPQLTLVNPIVRRAAAVGMLRTSVELMKLRRIVDFLASRPLSSLVTSMTGRKRSPMRNSPSATCSIPTRISTTGTS
jgi:hypothetical protein